MKRLGKSNLFKTKYIKLKLSCDERLLNSSTSLLLFNTKIRKHLNNHLILTFLCFLSTNTLSISRLGCVKAFQLSKYILNSIDIQRIGFALLSV